MSEKVSTDGEGTFGLAPLKREGVWADSTTGRELSPDECAAAEAQFERQVAIKQQFEAALATPPEVMNPDWLQAQVIVLGQFHSARDRRDAMQHLRGLVMRRIADRRILDTSTCANLVAPHTDQGFSWGW